MKSYNPKSISPFNLPAIVLELMRPYALSIALGLGIAGYASCDDAPSDGDGDVDIDSDIDGDGDSDSDGVSPFPPDYRVENNLHVGLDGVVTLDDNSVVLTAPELNPAYVEAGHETPDNPILTVIATHTEGTPDDPTDDVVESVISDQPTEWGQNTTGNLNLEERVIGEEIRLSATVTIPGTNPTTKNGITTVTYEQPTDPEAPVVECGLGHANACLGFYGGCVAESPLGHDLYGNWNSSITPDLGGLEINEEGTITGYVPTPDDVSAEPYDLVVEVHDNDGRVGRYRNQFFVDMYQTNAVVDGRETNIPEVLADDIAENCGNGTFQPELKGRQERYVFELSREGTPDGDRIMVCVRDRSIHMDENFGFSMSTITTLYIPSGLTFEQFVGEEPDMIQFEYRDNCR